MWTASIRIPPCAHPRAPVSQNSTACTGVTATREQRARQVGGVLVAHRDCPARFGRRARPDRPVSRALLRAQARRRARIRFGRGTVVLPRKEVIQPELPLRLPCYDFTPVTSPTFDGSLPSGLGHRLRVFLTPVVGG